MQEPEDFEVEIKKRAKLHEKQYFAKETSTTTKTQRVWDISVFSASGSHKTGFQDSLESLSPLTDS